MDSAGLVSEFTPPGGKLNGIITKYIIKTEPIWELGAMGLVAAAKTALLGKGQQMGVRGFEFQNDCFVRVEDKYAWEVSV